MSELTGMHMKASYITNDTLKATYQTQESIGDPI